MVKLVNTVWSLSERLSSSLLLKQGEWKKHLQVCSSPEEILSQFGSTKEGPFFKSKMEIKGCVYVQEIIAAFSAEQCLKLLKHNVPINPQNPSDTVFCSEKKIVLNFSGKEETLIIMLT